MTKSDVTELDGDRCELDCAFLALCCVREPRVASKRKACSTMDGLQLLFTLLISVQFVVIVQRDQLDIPGWTKGTEVGEAVGRKKLVWPR